MSEIITHNGELYQRQSEFDELRQTLINAEADIKAMCYAHKKLYDKMEKMEKWVNEIEDRT